MASPENAAAANPASFGDEEIVALVLAGKVELFELLMRRYNQRLYRAARAILRDDSQAEDVMQAAYVSAYEHLAQFRGPAPFGAWLTRIAANEALGRRRHTRYFAEDSREDNMDRFASSHPSPEHAAASAEAGRLMESLIEDLPDGNRAVFVLRDIEEMSTAEVAESLGITEESVKVRLHRARAFLRTGLSAYADRESHNIFAFHAARCDRVVSGVFSRIR